MTKENKLGYWANLWMPPVSTAKHHKAEIIHKLSHRELNINFRNSNKKPKIIIDRNYQDRYNDPGSFVKRRNFYGS